MIAYRRRRCSRGMGGFLLICCERKQYVSHGLADELQEAIVGQRVFINLSLISCTRMTVWRVKNVRCDGPCPCFIQFSFFAGGSMLRADCETLMLRLGEEDG